MSVFISLLYHKRAESSFFKSHSPTLKDQKIASLPELQLKCIKCEGHKGLCTVQY